MSNLSFRLKECRRKFKKTQKDMAKFLNLSERAYQHYELGDHSPQLDTLIKLADYFNVSIDYLVGRSDDPKRY